MHEPHGRADYAADHGRAAGSLPRAKGVSGAG